jgi:hypothetical protein
MVRHGPWFMAHGSWVIKRKTYQRAFVGVLNAIAGNGVAARFIKF